ncbi:hypothetical protein D3C87_1019490 [compost metagenome]
MLSTIFDTSASMLSGRLTMPFETTDRKSDSVALPGKLAWNSCAELNCTSNSPPGVPSRLRNTVGNRVKVVPNRYS